MNTLEKEFIPYQESLELKELGFDEPCIMQWTYAPELIFCTSAWGRPKLKTNKESYSDSGGDCISAPTFSQAFRFFREKYSYDAHVRGTNFRASYVIGIPKEINMESVDGYPLVISWDYIIDETGERKIYEEAELACLLKLIEIVKNK